MTSSLRIPGDITRKADFIAGPDETLLVTGANGFIGRKVVDTLAGCGFVRIRSFVRPSRDRKRGENPSDSAKPGGIATVEGNLLSRGDCAAALEGVSVIYHLAAATSEKSHAAAFLNSVVTTRNLMDAALQSPTFKRFVNVSSFTVYSTAKLKRGALLDENCETEPRPQLRGEAYCYAKLRQEEIVRRYGHEKGLPYVIVRPGAVYGPGKAQMTGRVGVGTFGIFLHMGGSNQLPLTYVDNCADAIVLAGLKRGVEGEVFNVVDDDLPTSRQFLKLYKRHVRAFRSIGMPKTASYLFCLLWENYSRWSKGQLPPVFNRLRWASNWKGNRYTNDKLKTMLEWTPRVTPEEGLRRYFEYCRNQGGQ
jgi:nucleoside-diphosphate-sugar epimerase